MLTYNDIQRNAILANIQWGYSPSSFFARRFLPVVEVTRPSGKYVKFDAAHLRVINAVSEGGARAPMVDIGASLADYTCKEHPRSTFMSDFMSREMGNDYAIPLLQMAQESLLVEEERALAAALNTTGNFTVSNYATPATLWDAAGADPWAGATASVKSALTSIYTYNGYRVDDVIMAVTPDVDLVLRDYARASIATPSYGMPTDADMARYFHVREYWVLSSVYNSAVMGQTDSLVPCFGTKQCWLASVPASNNLLTPSFGKTIVDTVGSKVLQERMVDPEGDKLILKNCYDQETISYSLAFWIRNCIS